MYYVILQMQLYKTILIIAGLYHFACINIMLSTSTTQLNMARAKPCAKFGYTRTVHGVAIFDWVVL